MKKLLFLFAVVLVGAVAMAGVGGYNGNTNLGIYAYVKCSTGMTCSKDGDKLKLVSSPSLVGPLTLQLGATITNSVSGDVTIASSASGDSTVAIKGFEGGASILNLYADEGDDNADKFSLKASAANVFSIQNNGTDLISIGTTGHISGLGSNQMVGFARPITQAAAVSLTLAQCGGIFRNAGAIQPVLPEASTVLGCSYTFTTANASNFDINPADGTDYIQGLTNAAGDAIRNATVGNSVTLTAVTADLWVATAIYGTWSDIN